MGKSGITACPKPERSLHFVLKTSATACLSFIFNVLNQGGKPQGRGKAGVGIVGETDASKSGTGGAVIVSP